MFSTIKLRALPLFIASAALAVQLSTSAYAKHIVQDSEGEKMLTEIPKRVAALNWDIAEQVIELGITPVAVPDIKGYNEWVVQPAIPEGVKDIGTRTEPNFSAIRKLNPDVILIASPQKDLEKRLSDIAPVLYYQTYSEDHNNAEAAMENFRRIGQALGREAVAEEKLSQMENRFAELNKLLDKAYPDGRPEVTSFRFASTSSVYLYGDNSMPQYALKKLGFNNAMPQPATQWGISQQRITKLSKIGDGVALYFEPFPYTKKLQKLAAWNSMPFVKANRVNSVAPSWSYGGAMSILYNGEALAEAMLELAEK